MRVAVIVVTVLVATTPSKASQSCMSQAEARQRFPTIHIYWHGADHCWDAAPGRHRIRQVQRRTPIREVEQEIDQPKVDQPKWRDSMSAMLVGDDLAQSLKASRDAQHDGNDDVASGARWGDRWVDIEQSPLVARWVNFAQVTSPPVVERKGELLVTLRSALLVLFAFVLTLATIEVLFRGSMYERPKSRGDTGSET
jgi:hypothetical protein